MCFLSLGVADEAHKVETNTHALFVDYKNVFENQYHLDVLNFLLLLLLSCFYGLQRPYTCSEKGKGQKFSTTN